MSPAYSSFKLKTWVAKKDKSFSFLNATQFLDAVNENLFKLILVFFLISYEGQSKTSSIMALIGAIFILPFILFSSLGGIFADRYSKTSVIRYTRIINIAFISLAWVCVFFQQIVLVYAMLFLFAATAAIFGPSKYGIIPDLVAAPGFLRANGIIAAFTFFAIIFGNFLASFLQTLSGGIFYIMTLACIAVALAGTVLSYCIAHIPAANPRKKWPLFIYSELYISLIQMAKTPLLLVATFAFSYFLFIGAFVQLNIIPYCIEILHMRPEAGGYMFILSAIGIGLGSLAVTKISGALTILPKAGLGLSVTCLLFMFAHPFWLTLIWLFALGVFGGFFLVPAQAFILSKSPSQHRGRNFATANFFSFVFAFLASGVLYLLNSRLKLTPDYSFAVVGLFNLLVCSGLFWFTQDHAPNRKNGS